MEPRYKRLIERAADVMKFAYAPYSQFRVGSALLTSDGDIISGCNVENAAYGPSNCAERTALFTAIAGGHQPKSFKAIAVIGGTPAPITPCGVCRQVMAELCAPDMPVLMANMQGSYRWATVSELLPGAFTLDSNEDRSNQNETGPI